MLDRLPIWILFIFVLVVVLIAMEAGYRLEKKFDRSRSDNETLVSVIVGAVLGLLGFILAFTFSIVYARFEARKELVRQDASAIERVWLRSQFMDQPDRSATLDLLQKYLDLRLLAVQARNMEEVKSAVSQSEAIQQHMWQIGVANAKRNSLSGLSAPYLQSLNDLIDIHNQRLAIGLEDRIPTGIWMALGALLLLSMVTIGCFAAIKGSKHSVSNIILAIAFSLLFVLVSALDDPLHGVFITSQQPLLNAKALMSK